jgi:hypothetical protein
MATHTVADFPSSRTAGAAGANHQNALLYGIVPPRIAAAAVAGSGARAKTLLAFIKQRDAGGAESLVYSASVIAADLPTFINRTIQFNVARNAITHAHKRQPGR